MGKNISWNINYIL